MDWLRFRAALIRGGWTAVLMLAGAAITYLLGDGALESIGITNEQLIVIITALLYAAKKYAFPDSVL